MSCNICLMTPCHCNSCNICQAEPCQCAPPTKIEKLVKVLHQKGEVHAITKIQAMNSEEAIVAGIKSEMYIELADILELWDIEE